MKLSIEKSQRQRLMAKEIPVSARIPISHLVSPTMFETKNGALGVVISVSGCPFELQSNQELNERKRQIAKFLLLLEDKFSVYVMTHRRRHNVYPEGDFTPGFAHDFNEAYKATFCDKPLYVNDQYIVLITKAASSPLGSKFAFMTRLSHKVSKTAMAHFRAKQLKRLNTLTRQAMQYLGDFSPHLLGEKEGSFGKQSELLEFFSIVINGVKKPFAYPKADVSSVLPLYRPFFGRDTMEWQGNTKHERRLAAVLSIQQYGATTGSTSLDGMLTTDFEYISVHSFVPAPNKVSLDMISTQANHLFDTKDPSTTQLEELEHAVNAVGSGFLSFGMHHNTIMILGNTFDELEDYCAEAQKHYDLTGIKLVRESLNLESAFWAQIPGNFSFIKRGAMISSENFSDYCSLHNYHHGYIDGNHLGSALMLVESSSKTPLYINFHEQGSGSKNDFSPGTTTITAPTGMGKTTLMLALEAQSQKYGGTRIFFDRGKGVELYVRAMKGFYSRIDPKSSTGFNPLALPYTPQNVNFLTRWLESLLITKPEEALTAAERKQVEEVINRSYTLPFKDRVLSVVKSFFPAHFSRRDHLTPWLRSSNPDRPDGKYAYLFDNISDLEHESDALRLDNVRMAGFDMTHLLKNEPESVCFSVMLYLFHRVEALIDGKSLMGIYLDEGWQLLKNPFWVGKIEEYISTARKQNTYLVFATQSPNSIAKSAIRNIIIEGGSTHIFLPNNRAEEADYIDGFKLTQREYQLIKDALRQERKFLVKQGHTAAMGTINLNGLEDYIAILSGNDTTVELVDRLRAEVGDDPAAWMPLFQEQRPR